MNGDHVKQLWVAIFVIFGLLTSMVVFSTGLVLARITSLESQVAVGILPITREYFRAVNYRLDRIEDRLERIEAQQK